MTAPRPVNMQPISTTTTPGSVHKEARGGVRHAHHSKEEVTTLTQISIRISIRTNPSLRDLVFGQAKINESLNKKLATNDKILEGIHAKVESLFFALKNQLSFNKMIETQLAQIAATVPFSEKINAVTTRGGKSTHDPPHPNHTVKATRPQEEEEEPPKHDDPEDLEEETPQKFIDTSFLPLPTRKWKTAMDEQFLRFVDMI